MKFLISLTLVSAVTGFAEFHDGPTGGDMDVTTGGDSGGISDGFNPVTDCEEIYGGDFDFVEIECKARQRSGCLFEFDDVELWAWCMYDVCFDFKDEEECVQGLDGFGFEGCKFDAEYGCFTEAQILN
jgi:hypothetical protein